MITENPSDSTNQTLLAIHVTDDVTFEYVLSAPFSLWPITGQIHEKHPVNQLITIKNIGVLFQVPLSISNQVSDALVIERVVLITVVCYFLFVFKTVALQSERFLYLLNSVLKGRKPLDQSLTIRPGRAT